MTTVFVSGAIANKPFSGGSSWTRLSWMLGLRQLGFDVVFVEQIRRDACVDSAGAVTSFEQSENRKYFRAVASRMHLGDSMSLVYEDGEQVEGLPYARLLEAAEGAAFLVNISGHLTLDALTRRIRRKVFVDLDPGFTQMWLASGSSATRLEHHDAYYTIGENIGRADCLIPTGGLRWRPIRQPVVLSDWPGTSADHPDRFTTVAAWRGPYGPIDHGGRRFGLKLHEFRKFLDLPALVPATFEIALDIHPADREDRERMRQGGWQLVDPRATVADPEAFRRYVQGSGAEFSAAQGIYVDTNSGWFSDRSVRYLASGRPVLVQDTGFSLNYPVGDGLVAFRTLDEAVAGAERILRHYPAHARAARALAEEHFASDRVLGGFVDQIMA